MFTWFKNKEQEVADLKKQASSSSQTSGLNGHDYRKLPMDDLGGDIEAGSKEDSTVRRSVG